MQKLSILFLWLALISCTADKRPNDVLSEAQLSDLLVDVYLSEARVDAIPGLKDSTIRYFLPREQKLLQQRGISDSVLRKTYAYYLAHPKELEHVYDAVIDTLTLHEQRANQAAAPKPVN